MTPHVASRSACAWPHRPHSPAPRPPCLAADPGLPPVTSCLWGYYRGDSFNWVNGSWLDLSGNNRHTPVSRGGGGLATPVATRGNATFRYLSGTVADGISFATSFTNTTPYTLFHVSRWAAMASLMERARPERSRAAPALGAAAQGEPSACLRRPLGRVLQIQQRRSAAHLGQCRPVCLNELALGLLRQPQCRDQQGRRRVPRTPGWRLRPRH